VLSEEELAAFAAEGLILLDRPLTWQLIGELLAALPATEEIDGE
jgi:hypothetical protein